MFRQRYEVRPSLTNGKGFIVFDHKKKRVEWCKTSYDVANLCALKMQGTFSALEHESRHHKRQHNLDYYTHAGYRQG